MYNPKDDCSKCSYTLVKSNTETFVRIFWILTTLTSLWSQSRVWEKECEWIVDIPVLDLNIPKIYFASKATWCYTRLKYIFVNGKFPTFICNKVLILQ